MKSTDQSESDSYEIDNEIAGGASGKASFGIKIGERVSSSDLSESAVSVEVQGDDGMMHNDGAQR